MKLESLLSNLQQVASQSISEHTDVMADMNRDQLMEGVDSSGTAMQKYKSTAYAEFKNDMNSRAGIFNPDLKLTGATHSSIVFQVQGDKIVNKVNDSYGLEEKYKTPNSNPFLLTQQSKKELIRTLLQKTFVIKCKQQL